MNKVFLDAAYAIALSSVSDKYHQNAEKLAKQIQTDDIKLLPSKTLEKFTFFNFHEIIASS